MLWSIVLLALGPSLAAGLRLAHSYSVKRGHSRLAAWLLLVEDLFLATVAGGLLGSRLTYVVRHPGEFDSLTDVLAIWRGGLDRVGGVVGALLAVGLVLLLRAMRADRRAISR